MPSDSLSSSPLRAARAYDAVIVGAGHNGLLAAAYLARAGFAVLVVERNAVVGGAVASAELTLPGYVHDLYATNMNLFLGSPAFAELSDDLTAQGLSFSATDRPYASAYPDGASLRVYRDRARTREVIAAHDGADAEGWDRLAADYDRFSPLLFEIYGTRLPSLSAARSLTGALRSHGVGGMGQLARLLLSTTRELGDNYLHSEEAKALLAAWGMHVDFGPDDALGALFPFLESFADLDNGMSVVTGGAGNLSRALAAVAEAAGAEIWTGREAAAILVEDGMARGVELADGERIGARRAVIANLTPGPLTRLLPDDGATSVLRHALAPYVYGTGTMMVHAALDGPVPWAAGGDLDRFGYVHIGPYVREMAQTTTDALNGILPADPLLVVGQTSAIDPSRAPEGGHVLWIQVRMMPSRIQGDALGEIESRAWDEVKPRYAERVLAKLAAYAPGVEDRIRDFKVLTPDDLEAANPNLVGGDSVGGSHRLSQNALFRPAFGMSGYELPIPRLLVVGAGTWPGAGVNGISGRLAALRLIEGDQPNRRATAAIRRLSGRFGRRG